MTGVLRALLFLAPHDFRERYGRDLIADFRSTLDDERKSGRSAVPYMLRASVDLLGTILRERASNMVRAFSYVGRTLAQTPLVTAAMIATLALAIGANVAAFSVINGVLLHPLPFAQPNRIVAVWRTTWINDVRCTHCPHAPYTAFQFRDRNRTFDALASYGSYDGVVAYKNVPRHVSGVRVGAQFLDVLGIKPQLGRGFTLADERPSAAPVAIVSHEFWSTALHSDSALIGRSVLVDAKPARVIGVLAPGVIFPNFNRIHDERPAMYLVLRRTPGLTPGNNWMGIVGRMKAGVEPAQAQADLDRVISELRRQWPTAYGEGARVDGTNVVPLEEDLFGAVRGLLYPVWGAVIIVLIIACLNVSNLLLARSIGRLRDMAVRSALGATARHVIGDLFVESLVLSGMAVIVGVVLARYGIAAYLALSPPGLHRVDQIAIDGSVVLYAFGIALLTAALMTVLPALISMRGDYFDSLRGARLRIGGTATAIRSLLVVVQIACTFALIVSCGLLVRSFAAYAGTDVGYDTRNGIDLFTPPINGIYDPSPAQQAGYLRRLRNALIAIPGVTSVAYGSSVPLSNGTGDSVIDITGGARAVDANVDWISPGFFKAIGVQTLQGREFTPDDRAGAQNVAIVNQEFAKRFLLRTEALGKRIALPVSFHHKELYTIVGVVPDVMLHTVGEPKYPEAFFSTDQAGIDISGNSVPFFLRTSVPPSALTNQIAHAWRGVDPREPVPVISSLSEVSQQSFAPLRANAFVLGVLGLIALILAVSGTMSVMAYAVSQRTSEIGLRIALGARNSLVLRWLLSGATVVAAAGIAIGIGLAALAGRAVAPQLYDVNEFDAATYLVVTLLLVMCTLLAAFVPAYRATLTNPATSLRYE